MSFGIFALLLVICTVIHAYDEDRDEPSAGDEDQDEPYAGDEPSEGGKKITGRIGGKTGEGGSDTKKITGRIGGKTIIKHGGFGGKRIKFDKYELHFATRKFKHLFNLLDINHDGHVDVHDFETAAKNFAKIANLDKTDSTVLRKLMIPKIWSTLKFDGGRPGRRVTKTRFVEHLVRDLIDRTFHTLNGLSFTIIDTDNDYSVSASEYANYLKAFNVPDRIAHAAFLLLDEQDHGFLGREDFIRLSADFLHGVDENSPSQFFFGTIKA